MCVDHVSLNFERGVYGLLGPNGAGKTTLMRMMVGVLPPSSGKVTLDGVTIGELGAKYRDILVTCPGGRLLQRFHGKALFAVPWGTQRAGPKVRKPQNR